MKKTLIVLIAVVFLAVLIVFANTPHKKTLNARLGGEALLLEVADTDALRARGLSGHEPLAKGEGMLFVFSKSNQYGFWMKDMLFPLDILWFDANYQIVDVWEHADPSSYPKTVAPRVPAQFVLEMPAGFFADHHLKVGNIIEIPR